MKRLLPVFVAILALAAPPAARADSSLIVIGKSIGAVRLGMAKADVVGIYGKPKRAERFEFASGERGLLAVYTKHGGTFRVEYAHGVVVGVLTAARYYRTSGGTGPGSPVAQAARLPGFRFDPCTGGYVRQAFGAVTFFVPLREDGPVKYAEIYSLGYFDC